MQKRIDILRILRDCHVSYEPENRRGWLSLECPRCHRPYLGFHVRSQVFHCWYCGRQPAWQVFGRLLGTDGFKEVAAWLSPYFIDGPARIERGIQETVVGGVYRPPNTEPLTLFHFEYLTRRKLSPGEVRQVRQDYQLASIPGWVPQLGNRIFMPLVFENRAVSWQARTVFSGVDPRYLTAAKSEEEIHHKDLVYGWDDASRIGQAVLVEGPVDVWKLGPGAVHGFGVQLRPAQVRLLSQLERVFVMFDSERRAQEIGKDIARQIAALGTPAEYVDLESRKDPGELTIDEGRLVMKTLGFPVDSIKERTPDENP